MWYVILLAVCIGGDQLLKWWVTSHLDVGQSAPLLPGIVRLTRLHNTGAAWSSFSGKTGLLAAVTIVLMAAVVYLVVKKIVRHPLGLTSAMLVLGGGAGNMIDRLCRGYVVICLTWNSCPTPSSTWRISSWSSASCWARCTTCGSTTNTTSRKRSLTMTRELTAATEHAGVRLDAFLSADGALTRSQAARLIAEGRVRVNGKPAAKSARLSGGETVTVDVPQLRETALPPQDIPLDVVYEDDDVIVVNKPTGLVVHPAPGHPDGTLVNALLHHCGDSLSGIGGEKRPGIVHRIDRDTSGLIIAAKNDAAHLALSAQLKDHSLSRTYECLVTGNMKQDSGTVDAPIGRSSADRKKMAVVPTGRRAVTHWEVVARYPGVTHLRCRLETGRTHQIRVHMAYIGHPILGDTVYGAKKPVPGLTGQCLHATGLRFIHPRTGEPVELHCPLPPEFTAMLQKLQSKAQ